MFAFVAFMRLISGIGRQAHLMQVVGDVVVLASIGSIGGRAHHEPHVDGRERTPCCPNQDAHDVRDIVRLANPDAARDHNAALSRLYRRHSEALTQYVSRMLSSENDAGDTVQEVFLFAWQHADRYDPRRGTVGAWLATMARSRALDSRRLRRAKKRRPIIDVTQPTRVNVADDPPDYAMLHAGITELPDLQRRLVDLAYFDGLTHSEIARTTGLPLGTIKSRLRLAVQHLRLAGAGRTGQAVLAQRKHPPIWQWLEGRLLRHLADVYFVDLMDPLGRLRRTDWGQTDARLQEPLNAIWRFVPPTAYDAHPVRRVLQRGRPEFVPHASAAWQRSAATSPQHRQLMERVQLQSLICQPLTIDSQCLGSLTVVRTAASGTTYRDGDVVAAGVVAGIVAAHLTRRS